MATSGRLVTGVQASGQPFRGNAGVDRHGESLASEQTPSAHVCGAHSHLEAGQTLGLA